MPRNVDVYVVNEIPQLLKGFPQMLWNDRINNYRYDDIQTIMKPILHIAPAIAIVTYVLMVLLLPRMLTACYGHLDTEVAVMDKKTKKQKKNAKGELVTKMKRVGPIPAGLMKSIMFLWNGMLCIMSVLIVLGCLPPYIEHIRAYGWWSTAETQGMLCDSKHKLMRNGSMNFWGFVFVISKYVELGDTLLLILKRSDVKVLQWWHHTTVLAFTWYAAYWELSCAWVFICFNAIVHSIMYYYFAMTMGFGWRFWWAKYLTHLQIFQMVVGIATVCSWSYQFFVENIDCRCQQPTEIMTSCFFMYGSYLVLFVQFFIEKYWSAKAGGAKNSSAIACGKDPCGRVDLDDDGEDASMAAALASTKKNSKKKKKKKNL